jgi:GT2 family glycosyltransferase
MYNTSSPVIYTIIVTYNGAQWIRKCLSALAHSSVHEFTIVVDNASEDDTVNIIKTEFPYIELIQNKTNLGFGAANNIAIEIALRREAHFVLLLNQDVYVYQDTIEQLLNVMQQHTGYGIVSPVQQSGDGKTLDNSFKKYLERVCTGDKVKAIEEKIYAGKKIIPVRFVNAAAWLMRAEVVQKVGYFHPLFFHYGEDNNYSSRVQYHGFKVGVSPNSYVIHDRNQQADKQKELLRKIKTIVRYTATDIRKNFAAAYLQALWKYFSLQRKAAAYRSNHIRDALKDEWLFLNNIADIRHYRKQMKIPL